MTTRRLAYTQQRYTGQRADACVCVSMRVCVEVDICGKAEWDWKVGVVK